MFYCIYFSNKTVYLASCKIVLKLVTQLEHDIDDMLYFCFEKEKLSRFCRPDISFSQFEKKNNFCSSSLGEVENYDSAIWGCCMGASCRHLHNQAQKCFFCVLESFEFWNTISNQNKHIVTFLPIVQ